MRGPSLLVKCSKDWTLEKPTRYVIIYYAMKLNDKIILETPPFKNCLYKQTNKRTLENGFTTQMKH